MKYLVAFMVSLISAWLFYFLVAAFFVQFDSFPIILVWLANLILFLFSSTSRLIICRFFFLAAIESLVPSLAAFLFSLNSDQEFLTSLLKEGRDPDLIRYLVAIGYDTPRLIITSLGFTLLFAVFAFFISPDRDRTRY